MCLCWMSIIKQEVLHMIRHAGVMYNCAVRSFQKWFWRHSKYRYWSAHSGGGGRGGEKNYPIVIYSFLFLAISWGRKQVTKEEETLPCSRAAWNWKQLYGTFNEKSTAKQQNHIYLQCPRDWSCSCLQRASFQLITLFSCKKDNKTDFFLSV